MKPCDNHVNGRSRMYFDKCLATERNVEQCSFGLLKQCWCCLSARLSVSERNAEAVISACVALQNIFEEEAHTSFLGHKGAGQASAYVEKGGKGCHCNLPL